MSVITTTLYTVHTVPDRGIEHDVPCPECDDVDAYIEISLYVRHQGEYVRFVECCVTCGKRIAVEERPAEVLIEVPVTLMDAVSEQLSNIN